jgi:hypothetical protein
MKYKEAPSITQSEVTFALASNDVFAAADALIRMSLRESDWEWAEHICVIAFKNNNAQVRTAALIAIGHLARRFHTLHLDVVLPAINKLRDEADCSAAADDALDDIAMFVRGEDQYKQ